MEPTKVSKTVTAADYQLYVLQAMTYAPEGLVSGALARLDLDRDDMAEASQRVQEQNYPMRPAFEELSELLSPQLREEQRDLDDESFTVRTFALPLWEDLNFEIYGSADGMVRERRFVRATGAQSPDAPVDPLELEPWSMTYDEFEAQYGPLSGEDEWPPYAAYGLHHAGAEYEAVFSWGLLQVVRTTEPR